MLVLASKLRVAGSPGGELCMQVSSTRWQHMSSRKPLATCLERLRSRKGVTQGSSVPSHCPQRNSDPEMRCATPNMFTLVVTPPQSNTHTPHMPHCLGPFLNSSHPCVVCIELSLKRWQCSNQRSHSLDVLSNDMEVVIRTPIIKRFRGVRGPMPALFQALLAVWCQERTARSCYGGLLTLVASQRNGGFLPEQWGSH